MILIQQTTSEGRTPGDKLINRMGNFSYLVCGTRYLVLLKDVSPPGFLHGDCTRNHTEKSIGPTKSISDKKA